MAVLRHYATSKITKSSCRIGVTTLESELQDWIEARRKMLASLADQAGDSGGHAREAISRLAVRGLAGFNLR